jgi:hypothetical protein
MKKSIITIALFNIVTFFWLTKFPDVLMFNLIAFFVLPLIVIVLILVSILFDFYRKKQFINYIFYKIVIIIMLIFIILQYKCLSAELIV